MYKGRAQWHVGKNIGLNRENPSLENFSPRCLNLFSCINEYLTGRGGYVNRQHTP